MTWDACRPHRFRICFSAETLHSNVGLLSPYGKSAGKGSMPHVHLAKGRGCSWQLRICLLAGPSRSAAVELSWDCSSPRTSPRPLCQLEESTPFLKKKRKNGHSFSRTFPQETNYKMAREVCHFSRPRDALQSPTNSHYSNSSDLCKRETAML